MRKNRKLNRPHKKGLQQFNLESRSELEIPQNTWTIQRNRVT